MECDFHLCLQLIDVCERKDLIHLHCCSVLNFLNPLILILTGMHDALTFNQRLISSVWNMMCVFNNCSTIGTKTTESFHRSKVSLKQFCIMHARLFLNLGSGSHCHGCFIHYYTLHVPSIHCRLRMTYTTVTGDNRTLALVKL